MHATVSKLKKKWRNKTIPNRILFIDRDGTILIEPPDEQVDSVAKLAYYPSAIETLSKIDATLDFQLVMVTNQDGLGTDSFPEEKFWPAHNEMLRKLQNAGVVFQDILIDRSFPHENKPTRKPGTALLEKYRSSDVDLAGSYVIGDRISDMQLAHNLGCHGILIGQNHEAVYDQIEDAALKASIVFQTSHWSEVLDFLQAKS